MMHTIELPMPPPMRSINVYLFEGDELTLVDTGPKSPQTLEALRCALAAIGYALSDIERIILTHAHLDHFGLAKTIAKESGATLWAHPQGWHCLTDYETEQERYAEFSASRLREADAPEKAWSMLRLRSLIFNYHAESVPADRVVPLHDGQVLSLGGLPWEVLLTPGHCLGHICLFQAGTGCLISGDCLLPDYGYIPVLYPMPVRGDSAGLVSAFANSLDLIEALEPLDLLPGHGPPVRGPLQIVAREREGWARACREIELALASGHQTAHQLWAACQDTFQAFEPLTGVEVVGCYLEAMLADGKVVANAEDGMVRFCRS